MSGFIKDAQEYKRIRSLPADMGIGKWIKEKLFTKYKDKTEALNVVDELCRSVALGNAPQVNRYNLSVKEALLNAKKSFSQNKIIDAVYYVSVIDDISKMIVLASGQSVDELRTVGMQHFIGEGKEPSEEALEHDFLKKEEKKATAEGGMLSKIYKGVFGDPLENAYKKEIQARKKQVEALITAAEAYVNNLLAIFDRMGLAKARGDIGGWIKEYDRIKNTQPKLRALVVKTYNGAIKDLIGALKKANNSEKFADPRAVSGLQMNMNDVPAAATSIVTAPQNQPQTKAPIQTPIQPPTQKAPETPKAPEAQKATESQKKNSPFVGIREDVVENKDIPPQTVEKVTRVVEPVAEAFQSLIESNEQTGAVTNPETGDIVAVRDNDVVSFPIIKDQQNEPVEMPVERATEIVNEIMNQPILPKELKTKTPKIKTPKIKTPKNKPTIIKEEPKEISLPIEKPIEPEIPKEIPRTDSPTDHVALMKDLVDKKELNPKIPELIQKRLKNKVNNIIPYLDKIVNYNFDDQEKIVRALGMEIPWDKAIEDKISNKKEKDIEDMSEEEIQQMEQNFEKSNPIVEDIEIPDEKTPSDEVLRKIEKENKSIPAEEIPEDLLKGIPQEELEELPEPYKEQPLSEEELDEEQKAQEEYNKKREELEQKKKQKEPEDNKEIIIGTFEDVNASLDMSKFKEFLDDDDFKDSEIVAVIRNKDIKLTGAELEAATNAIENATGKKVYVFTNDMKKEFEAESNGWNQSKLKYFTMPWIDKNLITFSPNKSANHKVFFNTLKKFANDPIKASQLLIRYSYELEDSDPNLSHQLLLKAEELLD